ncbi:tetratricopeptide repeat protein [Myxococcaceae bacterium GXIMD 01537]
MAKSLVERYEQLLAQDATSSVFVELAKALLEKGNAERAIEVCEQGVKHHPTSVMGQVLWGKALLQLGRPAEAMDRFDQALALDRDNPHGYNLISEVLLQRGLFRSALPILRKASALQPNNGRVREWLEQAQQALAGGAQPLLADFTGFGTDAPMQSPSSEEGAAASSSEARAATQAPRAAGTEGGSGTQATRAAGAAPQAARAANGAAPQSARAAGSTTQAARAPGGGEGGPTEDADASGAEASGATQEPQSPAEAGDVGTQATGAPSDEGDAATHDSRSSAEEAPPESESDAPESTDSVAASGESAAFEEEAPASEGAPADEAVAAEGESPAGEQASAETEPPAPTAAPARGGGLLGDLPPVDDEPSVSVLRATVSSNPSRPAASAASSRRSLFDDLPDLSEPKAAPSVAQKPKVSEQDAAAVAAAYERELREKLTGKPTASPSLLARHGTRIAIISVLVVVLGVGVGAFFLRRAAQGGQSLDETLDRAERLLSQDTRKSLDESLAQLDRAREMDDDHPRGWALTAWAHALRFADYGGSPEDRRQALEALEKPGVRAGHEGLGLATDVLVADERGGDAARRALLAASVDSAEVHALAGALLLEAKQAEKALERFKRALSLSPRHVRALVALGRYYQDFDDHPNALKLYASARELSPGHPEVLLGLAETRLELEQELKEALADVESLADADLSAAQRERRMLVQGELLSALGRHEEARGLLARGTKGARGLDFQLALGGASRAAGLMEDAQRAYEEALRLQPKHEAALEGLGRTLLARAREREVLTRLPEGGGRKVSLVRGAAYVRLGEWKRARAELARTRVNDRYAPEAIVYLALADSAEGNGAQAREVLEKALAATKGARADVRVALGQLYWRERALDKAQAQFDEALKDPRDYEGACALGRLLISRGLPDMAVKPLTQAVERNGAHGEARDALGRALLALGRTDEGLKQFEAWQTDNPGSGAAQKGFAFALFHAGRFKDAVAASERAVKLDSDDVEAYRTRALSLFATGDAKGAFAALERANKLNPKDAETFCEIANAFLRQGSADNAAAAFAAAQREGPEVPCGRIGEHYANPGAGGRVAAVALQALADKASAVWDRAFAQAARARVLLAAGDTKVAREAAKEAVRLAPHAARGHLALGLVALQQRQEAEARAELLQAVTLDPSDGLAHLALADLLARTPADAAQAVEEYNHFLRLAGSAPEAARVKKALPALVKRAGK